MVSRLGYGGNTVEEKLVRRALWAILYSSGCLYLAILSGQWLVFTVQFFICLIASVVFGYENPFESSPKEEGIICFLSSVLIPFMLR